MQTTQHADEQLRQKKWTKFKQKISIVNKQIKGKQKGKKLNYQAEMMKTPKALSQAAYSLI